MTRIAIRRALIAVYDKTGLEELARGLDAAGSRSSPPVARPRRSPSFGVPVTPVESLTGFPECLDGRVKTLHPRVHAGPAGRPRNPTPRRAARGAGDRAVRAGRGQPVPVPGDGGLRRLAPRSASSRSTSAGPRWSGPRRRTTRSVAVVVDPAPLRRRARRRRPRAASPSTSAGAWPPRRSPTPPPTTSRWPPGSRDVVRRRARAPAGRVHGSATWERRSPCCATARTRTSARRSTSRQPAGLASAEQLHGKEMSYNNYVDADAAWRAAWRLRRARRRDHQARQPVRHRGRRRRGRGAPQGARLRPGLRLRRRDRGQRDR